MAEKQKTCGNCANFEEARHPSGRVNKRHYGRCTWVVDWPHKIPMIYEFNPPTPYKAWYDSDASKCQCWEPR
jgi:hypothetical protein